MKNEGRALFESFFLHGVLVGAMIVLAGALTPPPKTIRLDFTMFEQPPAPPPQATEAAVSPLSPQPAAEQPSPEPPTAQVVAREVAKVLPKKIQPIKKKTVTQVAAVEPDPTPAPLYEVDNSAPVIASMEPVASASPVASAPAAGTQAMDTDEEYRRAHFKGIRDAILTNLRYPMMARRRGWSGKVEVTFLITPDGNVSELRIQASSGYPLLDEQALAAIRKAAPFTPPRIAALLVMPVSFQLN